MKQSRFARRLPSPIIGVYAWIESAYNGRLHEGIERLSAEDREMERAERDKNFLDACRMAFEGNAKIVIDDLWPVRAGALTPQGGPPDISKLVRVPN